MVNSFNICTKECHFHGDTGRWTTTTVVSHSYEVAQFPFSNCAIVHLYIATTSSVPLLHLCSSLLSPDPDFSHYLPIGQNCVFIARYHVNTFTHIGCELSTNKYNYSAKSPLATVSRESIKRNHQQKRCREFLSHRKNADLGNCSSISLLQNNPLRPGGTLSGLRCQDHLDHRHGSLRIRNNVV